MRRDLAADMPGVPFEQAILLAGRYDKRAWLIWRKPEGVAPPLPTGTTRLYASLADALCAAMPPAAEALVVGTQVLTGCGGGISVARLHLPAALGCRVRLPWGGRFG